MLKYCGQSTGEGSLLKHRGQNACHHHQVHEVVLYIKPGLAMSYLYEEHEFTLHRSRRRVMSYCMKCIKSLYTEDKPQSWAATQDCVKRPGLTNEMRAAVLGCHHKQRAYTEGRGLGLPP